jgi:hypothetical protein
MQVEHDLAAAAKAFSGKVRKITPAVKRVPEPA